MTESEPRADLRRRLIELRDELIAKLVDAPHLDLSLVRMLADVGNALRAIEEAAS